MIIYSNMIRVYVYIDKSTKLPLLISLYTMVLLSGFSVLFLHEVVYVNLVKQPL